MIEHSITQGLIEEEVSAEEVQIAYHEQT